MKNIKKTRDIKFTELNSWYLLHLLNINISKFFPFSAELTETHAIIWPGGHFPLCPPTALSPGAPSGSTSTAGRGHTGCPTADSGKCGSSGVRSAGLDSSTTEKNKKLKRVHICLI